MDTEIESVASASGLRLDALRRAFDYTEDQLSQLKKYLHSSLPPQDYDDVDVILGGSFARGEATIGSDLDYLVLFDETPAHRTIGRFMSAMEEFRERAQIEAPGRQGVFGDFDSAAQLQGRIGLEGDTNINMTRRAMLVFESVSTYDPMLRERLIRKILDRYCADYEDRLPNDPIIVPRFLLNDLVRYWRTIAVDFAAKQWRSQSQDWLLRYAKLRVSRKILFAGCLTSLWLTETKVHDSEVPGDSQYQKLRNHLTEHFAKKTPLARLLSCYDIVQREDSKRALRLVLVAYNRFIEILAEKQNRMALQRDGRSADIWPIVEELGSEVQSALEVIFFREPLFRGITERYGLL